MNYKLSRAILFLICLLIFSSMNLFQNDRYNCPMRNSIIEKFDHKKSPLANPASGSKIFSYSDSLVYPTMDGVVEKRFTIDSIIKNLIIRHNDSILSVYSYLDSMFVDIKDTVDTNRPLGIAQKNGDIWEIRFAIWDKSVSLNTDNILKCDNNLNK